ncbi:MAG: SLC13 family permease [Hyphomonadaceae bacterium]|nr:SLC13 family permease [Hyphomonadaceae bacterium]
MTQDQGLLAALFAAILGMLVWGRFRHDLVAAGGLLTAVVLGLVPQQEAFSGFANPAVVIVALVLVASRAFENSGVLAWVMRSVARESRPVAAHVAVTGTVAAALSAVINNVAALALLMPVDVQAARKAGRPPGVTLMPLAFATILGGMVTLIGTPPNIIASSIREEHLGAPYGMFDFTPVGACVALAGVAFVALFGWRLVPARSDRAAELISAASFEAELLVTEAADIAGKTLADLDERAESADVVLTGVVRNGRRRGRSATGVVVAVNDLLIVNGSAEAIASFIRSTGLHEAPSKEEADEADGQTQTATDAGPNAGDSKAETGKKDTYKPPEVVEAVVRADSVLGGRSAASFDLRRRYGLALLGMARAGEVARKEVRRRTIHTGDVLLLTGRGVGDEALLDQFGLIAVDRASVAPFKPQTAAIVAGLFAAAIIVATLGWLSFTIAIALAVAAYAALGIVPARDFYTSIEWPVVVMLACLLPIGEAFDSVGGTELIAGGIARLTEGGAPAIALVAIMVATMMLSDVLNNVATMVITGPVAIDLAERLGANPDTFLMGVAIAASCAFLTPIGHKNNTLIMGPGGFRFSDYWRMGLPLEIVVLAVATPMLLWIWPLHATAH